MNFLIIAAFVGLIIYAVWRWRNNRRKERQMVLDDAWRIVLSDPNYEHRRNYEERLRKDESEIRRVEGLSRRPR